MIWQNVMPCGSLECKDHLMNLLLQGLFPVILGLPGTPNMEDDTKKKVLQVAVLQVSVN